MLDGFCLRSNQSTKYTLSKYKIDEIPKSFLVPFAYIAAVFESHPALKVCKVTSAWFKPRTRRASVSASARHRNGGIESGRCVRVMYLHDISGIPVNRRHVDSLPWPTLADVLQSKDQMHKYKSDGRVGENAKYNLSDLQQHSFKNVFRTPWLIQQYIFLLESGLIHPFWKKNGVK